MQWFLSGTTAAHIAYFFFGFHSAIFKLTSAKFQTFANNSRTFRPTCMKFYLQFKINKLLYLFLTNFKAIVHMALVLGPKNSSESLG